MERVIVGPDGTNVPLRACVVNTDYMTAWGRRLIDLTHLTFCQWRAISAYLQGASTSSIMDQVGNTDGLRAVASACDEIGLVAVRNAAHIELLIRERALPFNRDRIPMAAPMLASSGYVVELQSFQGFRMATLFITSENALRPAEYTTHFPYSAVLLTCSMGSGVVVFNANAPADAAFQPGESTVCSTLRMDLPPGEQIQVQLL